VIQLVQVARSIRIRFGLITAPFRGAVRHFWTTVEEFGWLPRCLRHQHLWRSRVRIRNGGAANCVVLAFIDAC
jgi:hypothetical protein